MNAPPPLKETPRMNDTILPSASSLRIFIEQNSEPIPTTGCWAWLAALSSTGYGATSPKRRARFGGEGTAHRLSWKAFKGDIPQGQHVLHHCDVRCCVNPDHLFLGTNADNIRDSMAKGRRKGITRKRPSGLTYIWTKKPGPKPKG